MRTVICDNSRKKPALYVLRTGFFFYLDDESIKSGIRINSIGALRFIIRKQVNPVNPTTTAEVIVRIPPITQIRVILRCQINHFEPLFTNSLVRNPAYLFWGIFGSLLPIVTKMEPSVNVMITKGIFILSVSVSLMVKI